MRTIDRIILHCSDSDYSHHDDIEVIREWHTLPKPDGNGWSDVGYHYFIQRSGNVQDGRPLEKVGAHARPWNGNSIGICVHGRDRFYYPQFQSLAELVADLMGDFNIPLHMIFGHCDVPGTDKTCPNFDVQDWKDIYLTPLLGEDYA